MVVEGVGRCGRRGGLFPPHIQHTIRHNAGRHLGVGWGRAGSYSNCPTILSNSSCLGKKTCEGRIPFLPVPAWEKTRKPVPALSHHKGKGTKLESCLKPKARVMLGESSGKEGTQTNCFLLSPNKQRWWQWWEGGEKVGKGGMVVVVVVGMHAR